MFAQFNHFLWNGPLPVLLCGAHLLFTIRFLPQRFLWRGIRESLTGPKGGFAALSVTLAATLGTGNIIGVSSAIAVGGPGALFWCLITGILGMATCYAECLVSCRYRRQMPVPANTNAPTAIRYIGGPMYAMRYGLKPGRLGKICGTLYAFCLTLSAVVAGCTTQSAAMALAAREAFGISPYIIGVAAAVITGMVILGGMDSIDRFCQKVVPILTIVYLSMCIILLILLRKSLLPAISLILSDAFGMTGHVGSGGGRAILVGVTSGTFLNALRYGVARGLFTNEAGLGTAACAAASSCVRNPETQARISMTAVFWDTVVMCTLTGLVIVANMLARPDSLSGIDTNAYTGAAFSLLPLGRTVLCLCLIGFAQATLVGWCNLGQKGAEYLWGSTGIRSYQLVYLVMIFAGAVLPMALIWELTDFVNALMVLPNLLCLFFIVFLLPHRKG